MPRVDVRRGNVTACARCKSRKQRCDQKLPACSNCQRAGVDCVGVDTVTGRLAPRSYLQHLEERVSFLEAKLRAHGINPDDSPAPSSVASTPDPNSQANQAQSPTDTDNAKAATIESVLQQSCFASLSATTFPRHLGAGPGLALVRLLLAEIGCDVERLQDEAVQWNEQVEQMFPSNVVDQLPARDSAVRLTSIYLDHCDWFLPLLQRTRFERDLDVIYSIPYTGIISQGLEHTFFRFWMALAMGVLLLVKKDNSTPYRISDRLLMSAIKIIHDRPSSIFTGDLDHMETILLLAQYISLHPKSTGAWHVVGLATRLAVDLGLHEQYTDLHESGGENGRRKDLFWAAYSLELNVCTVLGRPSSIPDECISVDYPDHDHDMSTSSDCRIRREVAVWIIKGRQFEYQIQYRLFTSKPSTDSTFDFPTWKSKITRQVQEWFNSRPSVSNYTDVPTDIFGGVYSNIMILLQSPNPFHPILRLDDATSLAASAADSIGYYHQGFRNGTLRFFWRTIHKLFLSGTALLYCLLTFPSLQRGNLVSAARTCSAVLWGMVERYPPGRKCRDIFDQMVKRVLESDGITASAISIVNQGHGSPSNGATRIPGSSYGVLSEPTLTESVSTTGESEREFPVQAQGLDDQMFEGLLNMDYAQNTSELDLVSQYI